MKNSFLNIIYFLAYYAGINQFFYFLTRDRQRVITFHNIIPQRLFDHSIHLGVSCSDETFEFQIKQKVGEKSEIIHLVGLKYI